MADLRIPARRLVVAAASLLLVPLFTTVEAQVGTPNPAVVRNQIPELARNVLPGDFNGDGRVDLIGGRGLPPGELRIAFGRGNGTLEPARALGVEAEPSAVADLDGDGHLDIVARGAGGVLVLPGRGDGTFGSPRVVHAEDQEPGSAQALNQFAVVADFSGNGHPDIAVPTLAGAGGLRIYPGNGDFTFQPPVELPFGMWPMDATAGDFTGNGLPDLAVTEVCCRVTVFLNQGGLLFTPTEVPLEGGTTGLTAGDLNRDGHLDLVVAAFFDVGSLPTRQDADGHVAVLLGNGDGTFRAAVRYDTGVRGTTRVVLGDFTRDGLIDVATGNRSYHRSLDLGLQAWDSVTIFRGTGTGTLAGPVTFALDDGGRLSEPSGYAASLHRIAAADLDGDGRLDLIGSPGVVLLTRAAATNRPPTVSAGADRTLHSQMPVYLHAQGFDPDHHWLTYQWFDDTGTLIASTPITVRPNPNTGLPPGRHTFTVVVDDGHGGVASDAVTVISVDANLERGSESADIGTTFATGGATIDVEPTTFTVTGAGADIWDAEDAFHFVHHVVTGDFQIVARVTSIEHVHRWTKAGLMVRESLASGSRHASVFATPTTERPVAFQRRRTTNGTSVHTAGAFVGAPVWLALTRSGDRITAHYRVEETGAWTAVGTETLAGLPSEVYVGMAVTSHVRGTRATATFDRLQFLPIDSPGLTGQDVGTVSAAGSSLLAGDAITMRGSGADIWGTADAFQYLHRHVTGDFDVVVRVAALDNVHPWAKAGLMIRESLDAGSRHASLFATPTAERPVAFQRRPATNGLSAHSAGAFVRPPVWLALTRVGDAITARSRMTTADEWITLGTQVLPGLPARVYVGLAVTSHVDGVLATATFDSLRIQSRGPLDALGLTPADIGAVSAAGSSAVEEGAIVVTGSGADIWGTADAFHYLHQEVDGNFSLVVRVASVEEVHQWTKAGLMIRESLSPGSRHASVFATPTTERPVAFQRRPITDGPSEHTAGPFVAPPVWLALTRIDDRVTALYRASDADGWIVVGTEALSGLPSRVYVGLAVTSHAAGVNARATFDNLVLGQRNAVSSMERITIDQGSIEFTGQSGRAFLRGTPGFTWEGRLRSEGIPLDTQCHVPDCRPGDFVSLRGLWAGSAVDGTLRFKGGTYDLTGQVSECGVIIEITAGFTAPAESEGPTATVTRTAHMEGQFICNATHVGGTLQPTSGTVTVFLEWWSLSGSWTVAGSRFEFGE